MAIGKCLGCVSTEDEKKNKQGYNRSTGCKVPTVTSTTGNMRQNPTNYTDSSQNHHYHDHGGGG